MKKNGLHSTDIMLWVLLLAFASSRVIKLLTVKAFFRRRVPAAPNSLPSVTLLQPVTRSQNDLRRALGSRYGLDYPGVIQRLYICDLKDEASLSVCRSLLKEFTDSSAEVVSVPPGETAVASKTAKLLAALARARNEILVFVDDDVVLPPNGLEILVRHLQQPGVGAVFGLACSSNWTNLWSGLLSSFVNTNALLNYIPITFLTQPFTITGHCFAIRREVFDAAGGLGGMGTRIDDDHELARRIRSLGLRIVQTPLVYEIDNYLPSSKAYLQQMKRWFVIPRQSMLPGMTTQDRSIMYLISADMWIPPLASVIALATRRSSGLFVLASLLALVYGLNAKLEERYIRRRTPARWLPLIAVSTLVAPLQILAAMFGDSRIEWRGQQLTVHRGGEFEVRR